MTSLIMMVGLPGSGKSTWAKNFADKEVDIHSSDDIREELLNDINNQENNSLVFETLHKRVKDSLCAGRTCIYDATNLNYRRRKDFVSRIKALNPEVFCICVFLPASYERCLERNRGRERVVPESVIREMREKFDPPMWTEGWDEILVIDNLRQSESIEAKMAELSKLEHDNPNHALTVGQHSLAAFAYYTTKYKDMPHLGRAVLLHDIGKESTKVFRDSHGNKTDIAHYYHHEHVGAYDSFLYTRDFDKYTRLWIAMLIRWHMYPFAIEQSQNPKKTKGKLLHTVGLKGLRELMILHECDKAAH